jgi:acetolactate synthase I/II/III large subunit
MTLMDKTLSDIIVNYLEQFGVEYVFSVPGSPLGPLYDALSRSERRGGPRSILARHETGAAFMADGYARETGRIGVCCATTGPGATNLITGVACAYADHIPMLAITAQTPLPSFSRGPFQESSADAIDIVGMFDHCTRYNSLVTHPDQLENKLAAALTIASQPPKGPAHLSLPVDILRTLYKCGDKIAFPNLYSLATEPGSVVDHSAVEKLSQELFTALNQNQKVVLLIGHDCKGASEDIIKFAELINTLIITTQRGKSHINPYHPLARGVFGFAGHSSARKALMDESVALILAAGTDLGEWSTAGWDPILLNNKLVHIHNTKDVFKRSPMARMHVLGTISAIFKELTARIEAMRNEGNLVLTEQSVAKEDDGSYIPSNIEVLSPEFFRQEDLSSPIKAPRALSELVQRFPAETRFLIDNSNSVPWSIHYFFSRHPENLHLPTGFASMGWAIGASVGMSLGAPNIPVVCITGDGCYLMSGQEITVAVEHQLPAIFVVLNDNGYGMIKHSHRLSSTEHQTFAIPPVDFCGMAKAAGADAYLIKSPKNFELLDYHAMCSRKGPTLLEVYIDPEAKPPLGMF